MRKFELVVKPLSHARITVAKDRTTLKLPDTMSAKERDELISFAYYVNEQIPEVQNTVRGRFHKNHVTLTTKYSGGETYTFSNPTITPN